MMICIPFHYTSDDKYGGRKWRKVFAFSMWEYAMSVGFEQQLLMLDGKVRAPSTVRDYFSVSFRWNPKTWIRFGSNHVYYDGPHCAFDIGPFSINWENWNCKHCMPGLNED